MKKTFETLYRSSLVRAAVAFAAVTLLASAVVGGCKPPYVDGNRIAYSGTDIEGRPVSLAGQQFRGKVLLVDLWGMWCPPCVANIPALAALQNRYGGEGFEVVGLEFATQYPDSRDEYVATLRAFAAERGINYTVVQAGEVPDVEKVLPTLKSFQGFPTMILIGRDGTVRRVEAGVVTSGDDPIATVIESLLRERLPQQ